MKIKFNFYSLRYLCPALVIIFGLIAIIATGGGNNRGGKNIDLGPCDVDGWWEGIQNCPSTVDYTPLDGNPRNFITFDNKLIFVADKGCGTNVQSTIFELDETGNIKDIFDLSDSLLEGSLYIDKQIIINDIYYFISGEFLYEYDGVNPPQKIFSDADYQQLMSYNNKLYFNCCDSDWNHNDPTSCRLYSYDQASPPVLIGSSDGIAINSDINYIVYNDRLYFLGDSSETKPYSGLWCYNENTNELRMITNDIFIFNFVIFQDKLFFGGNDSINGGELWMIDGENPPVKITNLPKIEYGDSEIEPLIIPVAVFQGNLICAAEETAGFRFWEYDGINPINPLPVEDPYSFYYSFFDYNLYCCLLNNHFYFSTTNGIWGYDGINPPVKITASDFYNISSMFIDNGKLFWVTLGEVYVYNGISEPEVLFEVGDVGPDSVSCIYAYNSNYYATGYESETYGYELWKIDNTGEISLVEDFYQGVYWWCDTGD